MKFRCSLVCLLAALMVAHEVCAQAVNNGSVTGSPAANSGINAGNAPGWTGCGFSPDLCNVGFPSYSGNSQVPRIASPDGGTWLGIAALGECAQTTITGLTVGNSYTLRFCGANFGTAALYNGSPAAPIITVGSSSVTLSIPQVANTWNPYQLAFTATASSMTLRCSIPNGSNAYASLDGFNLTGSLCNPVILPAQFSHFKAVFKDCNAVLDWEGPVSETVKDFEVQRSADGDLFETLEKLNAAGLQAGHWVDPFPLKAAFYRIRMYNETGRVAESPILSLAGECLGTQAIVLGNPIQDAEFATLKFTATTPEGKITVQDLDGRTIGMYSMPVEVGGWNEFALPVRGLGTGIYVVSTQDGAQAKMMVR